MTVDHSMVAVVLLALTLAACGTSRTERGVSGGLLGAAGGAGLGAVTGTSTLGGAALGGAAGAATGVLTAPKLDFGHFEEENFIDQSLSETSSLRLSPSVTIRIRQMAKVELRSAVRNSNVRPSAAQAAFAGP